LPGFVNPRLPAPRRVGGAQPLRRGADGSLRGRQSRYFVRDFDSIEPGAEHRVFNTRPKTNGVWVRMRFRDGELMDGILANNLLLLEPYGFTVVPPSPTSSNQRVFVPARRWPTCRCWAWWAAPCARPSPSRTQGSDRAVRVGTGGKTASATLLPLGGVVKKFVGKLKLTPRPAG